MYVFFLAVLTAALGVCAYIDTRRGFDLSLPMLLRAVVPMVLSGVIVKIIGLIGITDNIRYIIAGLGAVLFYIVFVNIFKRTERVKKRLPIYQHVLGFLNGIIRGWLYLGFFLLYINYFFGFLSGNTTLLVILKPVKWLLFLSFL